MGLDLQKIIAELMEAGMSQTEIARNVEVEQPTISRYARGETKVCSYPIGVKLLKLYQRRVSRPAQ